MTSEVNDSMRGRIRQMQDCKVRSFEALGTVTLSQYMIFARTD